MTTRHTSRNMKRVKRLEEAKKLEITWENSPRWESNKDLRDLEIARQERLERADKKKALLKLKMKEKEQAEEMSRKWLPAADRKRIRDEEERLKYLEKVEEK